MSTKRVIVVTGGGSGMGRAIAHKFAANGDVVYILGRHLDKLQETAKNHPTIHLVEADLTVVKSVEEAVGRIIKERANVDVLVNNAGGAGHIDSTTPLAEAFKTWRSVIDTNLTTAFLTTQGFKKHLVNPGGRLIFISSMAGLNGSSQPGGEAYSASKAAIHGMARTLMRELSPKGITVNCVAPGFVKDTDFFSPAIPMRERIKNNEALIPLGRVGTPDDIAEAVFYLASPEASFVNGEILNVNGGIVLGR